MVHDVGEKSQNEERRVTQSAKQKQEKSFKYITTDFISRNNTKSVNEPVKQMLYNYQIYRRVVRNCMVVNQINRTKVKHGVYVKEDG